MEGRYKILDKTQTIGPKMLKSGLNDAQKVPLMIEGFLGHFLSKNGCRGLQILIIGHKRCSEKWRAGIKYLLVQQTQLWLKMVPRKYSWWSMVSWNLYFSKMGCRVPKMVLQKVAVRYEKPSKTLTRSQIWLKTIPKSFGKTHIIKSTFIRSF